MSSGGDESPALFSKISSGGDDEEMEEIAVKSEEPKDETQQSFLEKIPKIDHTILLWNDETLVLYPGMLLDCWDYRSYVARKNIQPLQGRDLGVVKHYSFSQLADLLALKKRDCSSFARFLYGRFYRASFQVDDDKCVKAVVKNWQLSFPPKIIYNLYPAMLYNDMIITIPGQKRRPNVARLMGYSIDRVLAVIYELDARCSLTEAMFGSPKLSDEFVWKYRLKTAIGVGYAIESLHSDDMIVGCIHSDWMLLDQEFKVHLCDFRLQNHVEKLVPAEAYKLLPLRYEGYGYCAPESSYGGENMHERPTLETDIYSYGILLLELISKVQSTQRSIPKDKPSNLVHESFTEVKDSEAKQITSLAMSCLHVDPAKRPKIGDVVKSLESLAKASFGS